MEYIKHYQELFLERFNSLKFIKKPEELYEPIDFALSAGGKRLRPVLTTMICDFYGNNFEDAVNPSIAIEIFHNFTLVHDDIMDNAPIRRGRPTVFKKYGSNTAILSGDTMFAKAYEFVTYTRVDKLPDVLKVFTKTAMEVCEGQQMDMNFEDMREVSENEYLEMIRLKTAVLMAASLKIGAILGGASEQQQEAIYDYGLNLGMVFQLQDDLLDTFGNEAAFGKKVGGDILDCKKTYLFIKAIEKMNKKEKDDFIILYNNTSLEEAIKIEHVKQVFLEKGSDTDSQQLMNHYHRLCMNALEKIELEAEKKNSLKEFAESLLDREH